ncbi:DBH-like monooxygenase protein 2 homolog [Electrophorus electricus]|uniref:DBH-like monooxygenase protein 2 homolog n=1 Tax=Electrophorus electricus TaxID=8005 RepID=UPI0015CFA3D3|nr:DBH-like monooxygenase protein 2 homolog [Electrophorus electricus]
MSFVSVLMPLVLSMVHVSGVAEDPLLPFSEYLDQDSTIRLSWGFDTQKDSILFEVRARTTGWVGFGFSPNGGMDGADLVIGGVDTKGLYFTDRHGVGNSLPPLDKQQDYRLLALTEADGQTVMKFERSIRACDKYDLPITEVPIKLIYAYGQSDDISYHRRQRGTKEVNLLKYMPQARISDSKYFDLTVTNFTIPSKSTHYHCKIMRLPALDQKYHIYRVEPLLENRDLVHHMLLYRCPPTVTTPYEHACYETEEATECYQAVAGWGVGGGAFELPEVAGIPVGGDGGKILYRLELHYNNQNQSPGIVDNSGFRLYYTAQLREYDAAVLQAGLAVAPGYAIPPNASAFLSYGLCDTHNIPQVLSEPTRDMQVFSVILHTHLTGRKVRVGHFRDGEQIDFLITNEHYNFEYQQAINLGKTKTVQMGDKLLVECTYNTSSRSGLTWVGLSTINEMCLAFLYYYPAMNLSNCISFPDQKALFTKMGVYNAADWIKMMSTKTWNEMSINDYQQTLKMIQQNTVVGNVTDHASYSTGIIPELKATSSVSCKRNRSEVTRLAVSSRLLLLLTAAYTLT